MTFIITILHNIKRYSIVPGTRIVELSMIFIIRARFFMMISRFVPRLENRARTSSRLRNIILHMKPFSGLSTRDLEQKIE